MPSLTIDLTNAQATRVQDAFKKPLSMSTDPSIADIKQWLIGQLRGVVHQQERRAAETAITVEPLEPT